MLTNWTSDGSLCNSSDPPPPPPKKNLLHAGSSLKSKLMPIIAVFYFYFFNSLFFSLQRLWWQLCSRGPRAKERGREGVGATLLAQLSLACHPLCRLSTFGHTVYLLCGRGCSRAGGVPLILRKFPATPARTTCRRLTWTFKFRHDDVCDGAELQQSDWLWREQLQQNIWKITLRFQ